MNLRSRSLVEVRSILCNRNEEEDTDFDDNGCSDSEEECLKQEYDKSEDDDDQHTFEDDFHPNTISNQEDSDYTPTPKQKKLEKSVETKKRRGRPRKYGKPSQSGTTESDTCSLVQNLIWPLNSENNDGILDTPPGAKGDAQSVTSPCESWSLLFSDNMLATIADRTNEQIARTMVELKERLSAEGKTIGRQTFYKETDLIEIKALIGMLYYSGANKASYRNIHRLYTPFSWPFFRATMQINRFTFLLSNLRFDDKATRLERKQTDKFAPIRNLWEEFIKNCQEYYVPHENCIINEQLLAFRGNCPFRIHMNIKPGPYGIKIVMINDSKTFYMFNAIPYVEKVEIVKEEMVFPDYIKQLSEPILGSNSSLPENITYFQSTKGSSDTFNRLCLEYSTARKTQRWPLRVFYGILDQAGINAFVLYTLNANNPKLKRWDYLEKLAFELVKPYMQSRLTNKTLRTSLKMIIRSFLNLPEADFVRPVTTGNKLMKKTRCGLCPSTIDRKTQHKCMECHFPMCSEHRSKLCVDCAPSE